ncbi:hypothetical protein [Streptomyces aureocirculatus]|uniref:hypothetical protein n=1 Tax=Streptomyces aureocirculatus TaxID=67275 RepID=UPI0012FF08D4|nr:hypothetical protein [Streptomyces aureocirculatus]
MKFVGFYQDMNPEGPSLYSESTPSINSGAPEYSSQEVRRYLHSGHPVLDVMESTTDVIGQAFHVPGGSSILTDGSFAWRVDLASYVEHYSIALPSDFLEFMSSNNFKVAHVPKDRLLEISVAVSSALGFHTDSGAAPRAPHK